MKSRFEWGRKIRIQILQSIVDARKAKMKVDTSLNADDLMLRRTAFGLGKAIVWSLHLFFVIAFIPFNASPISAQEKQEETNNPIVVVLRDLTVLNDKVLDRVDASGIKLKDGSYYRWSEILQIETDSPEGSEMKRLVRQTGLPEFRFIQRLNLGAWSEAEKIIDEIPNRQQLSAELRVEIAAAKFLSGLEQGKRESAAAAYLDIQSSLQKIQPSERGVLTETPWGQRVWPLANSPEPQKVPEQFVPVFFDRPQAIETLEGMSREKVFDGNSLVASVYAVCLAIAANRLEQADEIWLKIPDDNESRDWKNVLNLYLDVAKGRRPRVDPGKLLAELDNRTAAQRGVLLWVDALDRKARNEASPRLAPFLKIAAIYRKRDPEFAAGALYQAFEMLEPESIEAKQIRKELETSFSTTLNCRKLSL